MLKLMVTTGLIQTLEKQTWRSGISYQTWQQLQYRKFILLQLLQVEIASTAQP